MQKSAYYQTPKAGLKPNLWDILALLIILSVFAALALAASRMKTPYQLGETLPISLSPTALPRYAINTVLRMFIAIFFSILFTFIVAPIAAKSRQAEKILIPLIDILQSVPILGVLALTVVAFIQWFPNSLLGPECAAIFAIFTSQVWNMTLSFYQSIRTMPKEFYETAEVFHLSAWQRFWRIEVPYAIPGLLWNTMISMSAGWFFVVASEAISVSNQNIKLPGIGSYISVAIANQDLTAIFYAIITMFIVILGYDQFLFRPLLTWAERFNTGEDDENPAPRAWVYNLFTKTRWVKNTTHFFGNLTEIFLNPPRLHLPSFRKPIFSHTYLPLITWVWNSILLFAVGILCGFLWNFINKTITLAEIGSVFYLGAITGIKVTILIVLASLLWVPIGVWVGLRPETRQWVQLLTQLLAAFPANLIYPLFVTLIVGFKLNVDIWTTPLMILGTQWYILFNVIVGTAAIPKDLHFVAKNFRVTRWLWWKKFALPAIFPYYITGAMAAAAGCWNASIVADVLEWGQETLIAKGLGSYISQYTTIGDFPRIALGISVMCFYVLAINFLVWQRLYNLAATRFSLE